MKKILVLHRYPPRQVVGTNASFLEFLEELVRQDFEVFYLTYRENERFPKDIEGVKFVRLPFRFNRGNSFDKIFKTYLWMLLAPIYVRFLQNKHKLDLVYCDDSVPYYGYFAKLLSPRSKVVIRLGDLQSGYKWAEDNPEFFEKALKWETKMWKKLNGVITISEPFKDFIIKRGVKEDKINVVKESINLKNTDFSDIHVPKTGKFMFHGSMAKCKGLETLLEAFKIFHNKYPETELIVAGGGEVEEEIQNYAQEIGIENTTFTGWYDHAKLARLMKDIQISIVMRSANMANDFVVTTCLLENWAYKKPVIVPNLAAFREVIEDEVNGVFFEPGNEKDLAKKMEKLYTDDGSYEKLVKNGLKTANEVFNQNKIAKDMVSALKSYL
jgi:glycosyltransferase involved in cell wall biosynthesis